MRVLFDGPAFPPDAGSGHAWDEGPGWPASWIAPAELPAGPGALDWRCDVVLAALRVLRVHVSADERYLLSVDGVALGSGPERCDLQRWAYETYDLDLAAGPHRIEVRTWHAGRYAPWAQSSLGPALLLAAADPADRDLVATGHAAWRVRPVAGLELLRADAGRAFGGGAAESWDAGATPCPWGQVRVEGPAHEGFRLYCTRPGRVLRPALLPAQAGDPLDYAVVAVDDRDIDAVLPSDGPAAVLPWPLTVPAGRRLRLAIDLTAYACHRPQLTLSGDGTVQVRCSEAGVTVAGKGRRDTLGGMRVVGITDRVRAAAAVSAWSPLWWRAGRFVLVVAEAGVGPLRLHRLGFVSTGYPLQVAARWPDDTVTTACLRTLRMCMHETFVDCPYYEQLQYVGDTRIQALLTHVLTRDDRPAVAALRHFAASALNPLGHPTSNHPAAGGQVIPTFVPLVAGMAHDLLRWRGRRDEITALLPVLRRAMDALLRRGDDGQPVAPPGWNFIDAEHGDHHEGVPPGCRPGESGSCWGWLLALGCSWMGDLESAADEPELAARWRRLARGIADVTHAATWDGAGWRFARGHARRSPHAAVLALLADLAPPADLAAAAAGLFTPADPPAMGIMFSHYLFEAAVARGRLEAVRPQWRRWREALEQGFTTTPEGWGATRSDCHAWGAHPLYWLLCGVAGVRPAADGFARVLVAPQPADGEHVQVSVPHPGGGEVRVDVVRQGDVLRGRVSSPVDGLLRWGACDQPLRAGVALEL